MLASSLGISPYAQNWGRLVVPSEKSPISLIFGASVALQLGSLRFRKQALAFAGRQSRPVLPEQMEFEEKAVAAKVVKAAVKGFSQPK